MLTKLFIKNFAIISQLDLQFQNGLIALTGETGAGKSIILGAINLLLGARADSNSLYNIEEKCVIEAHFFAKQNHTAKLFLQANDIEPHDEIIIRREIQSNGRSRAFVNDTPVVLNQLASLGEMLIDLHRQFDTQEVKDSDYQLEVLDTIATNSSTIAEYSLKHKTWKEATNYLNQMQTEQMNLRK